MFNFVFYKIWFNDFWQMNTCKSNEMTFVSREIQINRGNRQETLHPGFVLFGTRQQGVPVILRELVLSDHNAT
ncbi:unnamed protein product [Schistosoma margrebowiei]|uniref:Uncharacterized protein n=1 Tax=Schistosoma margrebowiei TaxID=48269 RepID=A0A183M4I6_9TREM|nr:unnamed protein product [Schistosoma margrebowiei]